MIPARLRTRLFAGSLIRMVFLSALFAGGSRAGNLIPVTSLADSGPGTLRQAIQNAAAGDTINFSVCGTLTLTSAELQINKSLTIEGPGARRLSVRRADSAPNFRIFNVSGNPVTISGLTISNGKGVNGAGVYVSSSLASLDMVWCTLHGNVTGDAPNSEGGAVFNYGNLEVIECTLSGNTATGYGGAIRNENTLKLTNCTIANNKAGSIGAGGGAVYNKKTLIVRCCTINSNTASDGSVDAPGGIWASFGTARVGNTIVAGNTGSAGYPDVSGAFISEGFNLIRLGTGGTGFTAQGDQVGVAGSPVNANLGPLQDNGGGTDTMVPVAGSPARDQGKNLLITEDQRRRPRPIDLTAVPDAPGGDGSDIGALEVQTGQPHIVTSLGDYGPGTLRQVIEDASFGAAITFAPGLRGTIQIACGSVIVDKDLTITAPGADQITLSHSTAAGTQDAPIFYVQPPPDGDPITVTVTGLTFANGRAETGGAILNDSRSDLTVSDCVFQSNTATRTGASGYGGAVSNGGYFSALRCLFQDNRADGGGAGILSIGTLSLEICVFTLNVSPLGGGVYSSGVHNIWTCTFSKNTATSGAGLYIGGGQGTINSSVFTSNAGPLEATAVNGGGAFITGAADFTNCTFYENRGSFGAGIGVGLGNSPSGKVTLDSCTVTGNGSSPPGSPAEHAGGGGLAAFNAISVRVTNTIIADNEHTVAGPDIMGGFTSGGFNLIGTTSGGTGFTDGVNHDRTGTNSSPLDAWLGPLRDNGGPTLTCAPAPISPALDAGKTTLTVDQRGWARRFDEPGAANAAGSDLTDIGAVESQPGAPVFIQLTRAGGGLNLTLKGAAGYYYQLQSGDTLSSFSSFTDLGVKLLSNAAGEVIFNDPRPVTGHRFYRAYRVP